jgi:cytoskeletal protein RodZ
VNPGGGSGWDEAPLDIQIPDDARELDRDVLAYHRELRAQRRRNRLHRLTRPFSGPGTVMPLLASILAVCLVAGAMLSVATFSPSTAPADRTTRPSATAGATRPAPPRSHATTGSATASQTGTSPNGTSPNGTSPSGTSPSGTSASSPGSVLTSTGASPSGTGVRAAAPSAARTSGSASVSARSSASASARSSARPARASSQTSPPGSG